MLVLSRKIGQELVIGDNIRIVISRVAGNRVSLGIEAPDDVHIMRGELKAIREEFLPCADSIERDHSSGNQFNKLCAEDKQPAAEPQPVGVTPVTLEAGLALATVTATR